MADGESNLDPNSVQWRIAQADEAEPQLVIRPRGETDLYTTPEIRASTNDLLELNPEIKNLNFDLSKTEFIDETFLGILVGLVKRMRSEDGQVSLVCDQPYILKLFEITGLDNVFDIQPVPVDGPAPEGVWQEYDSTDQAVRARLTMIGLGRLAAEIQEGLKTYEEQLLDHRQRRQEELAEQSQLKNARRSHISESLVGTVAFIEIKNGSTQLIEETTKIFNGQLENPDIKHISIRFPVPSYIEKDYLSVLTDFIAKAKDAGKKVTVIVSSKPDDVIPEGYNQLLAATGQVTEEPENPA